MWVDWLLLAGGVLRCACVPDCEDLSVLVGVVQVGVQGQSRCLEDSRELRKRQGNRWQLGNVLAH